MTAGGWHRSELVLAGDVFEFLPGPLTYFFNVWDDLEPLGYPLAVAVLDPYNSVDVRGEQLVYFVLNTLTTTRSRKVNLYGHSQGGIDSRYAASPAGGGLGDRIGAVIAHGTPRRRTPAHQHALDRTFGVALGRDEAEIA
jgi:triacylglycerol esterase/lipase EstA (alpha/beta hydrolase family)